MNNTKLMSYKLQSYLALIPFIGIFIVYFSSFTNIAKTNNNKKYIIFYFILTIIPAAVFFALAYLIMYFVLLRLETGMLIALSLILMYVTLLCISILSITIEKACIKKLSELSKMHNNLEVK